MNGEDLEHELSYWKIQEAHGIFDSERLRAQSVIRLLEELKGRRERQQGIRASLGHVIELCD